MQPLTDNKSQPGAMPSRLDFVSSLEAPAARLNCEPLVRAGVDFPAEEGLDRAHYVDSAIHATAQLFAVVVPQD